QLVIDAEWHGKLDRAGVGVDRHQFGPRTLVARHARPHASAALIVLAGQRSGEREERAFAVDARAVVGLVAVGGVEAVALRRFLALDPADQRGVLGIDVDEAGGRIGRRAAPVHAARAA